MLLISYEKLTIATVGPSGERHLLAHYSYHNLNLVSFIRRTTVGAPSEVLDLPDELNGNPKNLREFLDMLQANGTAGIKTPTHVYQ